MDFSPVWSMFLKWHFDQEALESSLSHVVNHARIWVPMSSTVSEKELATLWFLAARAMAVADGGTSVTRQGAGGLYAQAILGLSEEVCAEAKSDDSMATLTLLDCLGRLAHVPTEVGEKIMTGVMMIAYADRSMHPLEVRWASMLASALSMSVDDFQRCCVNARVISGMLGTHAAVEKSSEPSDSADPDSEQAS